MKQTVFPFHVVYGNRYLSIIVLVCNAIATDIYASPPLPHDDALFSNDLLSLIQLEPISSTLRGGICII